MKRQLVSPRKSLVFPRLNAAFLAVLMALPSIAPAMAEEVHILPGESQAEVAAVDSKTSINFTVTPCATSATNSTATAEETNKSTGLPLSSERLDELARRLPPLIKGTRKEFLLPEQTLVKPPRSGMDAVATFPPEQNIVTPIQPNRDASSAKMPLKILRVSPQGAIATAKQVAVTFSQPMVPLQEAGDVDVTPFLKMTPQPAGHWRWAGTQTLVFTPARKDKRLPASTTYLLTFPDGLKSANGSPLNDVQKFTFKTPTLEVTNGTPNGADPQIATPTIFVQFNQDINKEAIIPHIILRNKTHSYPLRPATASEIAKEANGAYKIDTKTLPANQWVALRPLNPLPLANSYDVVVQAGSTSAEGPDKTATDKVFSFSVHGPLSLKESPENGVSADRKLAFFRFNNFLLPETQDQKQDLKPTQKLSDLLKIAPVPENIEVRRVYDGIGISGDFKTFQKYTVTIDGALKDVFDQSLGKPVIRSWTTGARDTVLSCNPNFVTIAHGQKPTLKFYAQATDKVTVKIHKVTFDNWVKFLSGNSSDVMNDFAEGKKPGTQPAATKMYTVGNDGVSVDVDLQPYLNQGHGQFIVVATCPNKSTKNLSQCGIFAQVTDIGIDVFRGKANKLNVFASSLTDGKPLSDCHVSLLPETNSTITDIQGLASIESTKSNNTRSIIVTRNGDRALMFVPYAQWVGEPNKPTIDWYCATDRTLYRPGDIVHVKGWQRGFKYNQDSAIRLFSTGLKNVTYTATSPDGSKLSTGVAKIDDAGGFNFEFAIPQKINLGDLQVKVSAPLDSLKEFPNNDFEYDAAGNSKPVKNYSSTTQVAVQEFRRPEFSMKTTASKSNIFIGESSKLTATANYFGGGDLPATPVHWSVNASSSFFSPPGWSEYSFDPILSVDPRRGRFGKNVSAEPKTVDVLSDSHGSTAVDVCVTSVPQPIPVRLNCSATFTDVNRQEWTDRCEVVVHPSRVYAGIKAAPVNDKLEGAVIVTDCDGKAIKDVNIALTLRKINIDEELIEVSKLNLISDLKPVNFTFKLPSSGNVEVMAEVKDQHGMPNRTATRYYINRSKEAIASQNRENEAKTLTLTADKTSYAPGDSANVTIKSPIYPAQGLLLISRNSLVRSIPLELKSESTTVSVPLTADDYPDLIVEALVNGADYAFANGQINLSIPAATKKLALSVRPENEIVAPGSDTKINVKLLDSSGHAVSEGHVAIAIVDESVFALRENKWLDLLDTFYPSSAQASLRDFLRKTILLKEPARTHQNTSEGRERHQILHIDYSQSPGAMPPPPMPGGGTAGSDDYYTYAKNKSMAPPPPPKAAEPLREGLVGAAVDPAFGQAAQFQIIDGYSANQQKPFAVRTNFSELALFAPDIVTDASGNATVKFHLPDSTTKYRIMAAAVAGNDNFGITESSVSTRMNLVIKPSLPRFLNFGDHCELPFVIQNQTDKPLKTDLILRVRNAVLDDPQAKLSGSGDDATSLTGRRVEVPANSRLEVRFPITTKALGTIDIQCAGVAEQFSDAANASVPVILPATTESFAAYGQIDKGSVTQKLSLPKEILPEVGGLTITTSSTAVQSLADAYFYLRDYQFDCSEQLSSQLLGMLSLHDSLAAFGKLDSKGEDTFKSTALKTIQTLVGRQNPDGGFSLWKQGEKPTYPYVGLQVCRALHDAKSKGYEVPDDCLALCIKYLKEIDKHIDADQPAIVRAAIQAYALNVRYLQNDIDAAGARKTLALAGDKLTVEEAAWLLPVLAKEPVKCAAELAKVRNLINNSIIETASTASTTGQAYGPFCYRLFYSNTRQDALVLSALIADQPQSELISKLAKGLLAHQKNGAWNGTQENWVALDALDRYFSTYEKTVPDFTANQWLGSTFAGAQKYSGRSIESHSIEIPTEYLVKHEQTGDDVTISKDGPGRLYYRVGLEYAPADLRLKSKSSGFSIEKTYEGADNKNDVTHDSDGTWHFKAGASVRCKVHFSAEGNRYHVALMSPLPGGCEPVNALLAGNRISSDDAPGSFDFGGLNSFWWSHWYDHQNIRDHQVEAFGSVVYAGEQDFDFIMRATTPGHFVVPPTKVEEMYQSETFGRTPSDAVVIE